MICKTSRHPLIAIRGPHLIRVTDYLLWIYLISLHEEVVRLDVPVDEVLAVDVLDPRDQLVGQQQHCLQAEPPATKKLLGLVWTNIFFNSDVLQLGQICIVIVTKLRSGESDF